MENLKIDDFFQFWEYFQNNFYWTHQNFELFLLPFLTFPPESENNKKKQVKNSCRYAKNTVTTIVTKPKIRALTPKIPKIVYFQ